MKGLLLLNLGTPDAPHPKAVRRYLKEFLSDPRVIDLPAPVRWVLTRCFILPFRPKRSAHAYQQIWSDQGSPLLVHSQALQQAVQQQLGNDYGVALGMRYGNPSIQSAVDQLKQQQCESITVLPLFPQYSSAATGSAIEKAVGILKKDWSHSNINIVSQFCDHAGFIESYASIIKKQLDQSQPDCLLLSYHGLPERHLDKSGCSKTHCDRDNVCPVNFNSPFCYRAQCYQSSRLIAGALGLNADQYATSFQSRLGKTPWIQPYTDQLLEKLIAQGVKKLAVACPSFVADCLETLEEIGMRARDKWLALGGLEFYLIPCLNDDARWVDAVIDLVKR